MVRYCKAHIGGAIGLNNLTLHTRVLDSHILRRARSNAGFFDRRSWMNNDFAPGLERFHARGFVCLDLIVRATDVGPIVRGKPANRQTVDEYMRLLSQIENRDGTTRAPKQKLKTIGRELSSTRSMEIGQTGAHGNFLATIRFE